ncbi:hypothetical protein CO010_00165 [Candidatus Shapirobacteria bacterium CG_4_8_14_3_um_filter_39_11]|uniref:Uncharacterized protein n=1 Tax=Candidatus Shapirobacteria bacterium CG_4_8_14_3_um_filter_39_11 TaxID=1974875 RepID=A0A2M8GIF5_9BACT|nr:MAG: hypothetical protein CO010_00165 [Candidatus Shapirobacteria bacterium CG_4_8_14_3_um_filter_39_11]
MEKPTQQTSEDRNPADLDNIFMDLFTPEFLANLPPEQIKTVVNNLKLVESSSGTLPPEWLALRNVLQNRGFLE